MLNLLSLKKVPKVDAALVLSEMMALFEEEGKSWAAVRGLALDRAGRKADPVCENAVTFSIEGAMHAAAARCGQSIEDVALESVRQRIYMCLPECLPENWQRTNYDFRDLAIQAWEAFWLRSQAQVLALLREARESAIALAERPKVF